MLLKWTRIWCVRPVAMPTPTRQTPGNGSAHVMRDTAVRARRALVDIFCRLFGSRPIGSSMRRPGDSTPQTSAVYSFSPWRSSNCPGSAPGAAAGGAPLEPPGQRLVGGLVLRHHHQPGRPLVEPMDDAWTQLAANAAQVVDV